MRTANTTLLEALQANARTSRFPQVITSEDRRVLFSNAAFASLCGHTDAEMLGRNPGQVLQGPETNQDVVGTVRQLLRHRAPFEFQILNYHCDGHPYRAGVVVFPFESDGENYFLGLERLLPLGVEEDLLADPDFENALSGAATLIDQHGGAYLSAS